MEWKYGTGVGGGGGGVGICSRLPGKFVEKFRQGVMIMDKTRADRFF